VFPHDHKLTALPDAVDSAVIRAGVEACLERGGLPGVDPDGANWRCGEVRCDRVKYMPDKRCVLRVHAILNTPSGRIHPITFFSKTYPDGRCRGLLDMQSSACEALHAQNAAVAAPQPFHHLATANTLWFEDWGGVPLVDAGGRFGWEDLASRAARAVAALHRSRMDALASAPAPDEILRTAFEGAACYVARVPEQRARIESILERLSRTRPALRPSGPRVPIHGACRPEQMLVRGSETALVDFDALTEGDPLLDVAEFIASLQFLELGGAARLDATRVAETFCRSYASEVPWPCDGARMAWYALAFVISKMHGAVKHLDLTTLGRLEREGETLMDRWRDDLPE